MAKKTKTELFNEILNDYPLSKEHREMIEHEIALLAKSSENRKPTARQKENEELMELVVNEFENLRSKGFITQAEFAKSVTDGRLKGLTPQRIQPLLNKLVAKNVLIKSTSKNTPVYTIG